MLLNHYEILKFLMGKLSNFVLHPLGRHPSGNKRTSFKGHFKLYLSNRLLPRVCVCELSHSLRLCDCMGHSPSGFSVHGILQANTGVSRCSLLQGDLSYPGVEPRSSALQVDSLPCEPPGSLNFYPKKYQFLILLILPSL